MAKHELARHGLVRGEHELFDEPMGDVALRRADGLDVAGLVEHDLGLGQIEVDRAALLAARAQDLVQRVHPLELGEQIRRSARSQLRGVRASREDAR